MQYLLFFPLILVSYEIATYLSNDLYLPALPTMMRDLNLDQPLAQATLTVWFIGSASWQLLIGPLSERFGRRPVLLTGGVLFIFASTLCAITDNITLMLIGRFLQGSAVCSAIVAGYATIHDMYDDQTAVKVLALMGSITLLAPVLGPLVGGILLQVFHWRALFWILTIWGILSVSLLFCYMPETNQPSNQNDFSDIKLNYLKLICDHFFMIKTLAYSFLFAGFIAWLAASPLLLIDEFKMNEVAYGLIQCLIFGSFIVGTIVVKKQLNRYAVSQIISVAIGLILVGVMSLFGLALMDQHHFAIAAMMLHAFGCGLFFAPMQRLAISGTSQSTAITMSMFSFIMSLSGALGSFFVSQYFAKSLLSIAAIICFFSILSVSFTWFLRREKQLVF